MVSTFRWISSLMITSVVVCVGVVVFNLIFVGIEKPITAEEALGLTQLHSIFIKVAFGSLVLSGFCHLLAKDLAEKARIRRTSTASQKETPENRRRLK